MDNQTAGPLLDGPAALDQATAGLFDGPPRLMAVPVPAALSLLTGDGDRLYVTTGAARVTGTMVGYRNTRTGNRAYVRDLLAQRQPAFAAALERAAREMTR